MDFSLEGSIELCSFRSQGETRLAEVLSPWISPLVVEEQTQDVDSVYQCVLKPVTHLAGGKHPVLRWAV